MDDSPIILILKGIFGIVGAIITTALVCGFTVYLFASIGNPDSLLTIFVDLLKSKFGWQNTVIFSCVGLFFALIANRVFSAARDIPNAPIEVELVVYVGIVGLVFSLL